MPPQNSEAAQNGVYYAYTMLKDNTAESYKLYNWGSGYGVILNGSNTTAPTSGYLTSGTGAATSRNTSSTSCMWINVPSGYYLHKAYLAYINGSSPSSSKTYYSSSFIKEMSLSSKNSKYYPSGGYWLGDQNGWWDGIAVIARNKGTINYYGNGATSGSTSSQTIYYNQSVTTRSNGFSKTGYHFNYWYHEYEWDDGSVDTYTYSANSSYSWTSIARCCGSYLFNNFTGTLYADWSPNQYDVYFNKADGTGGTDSTKATFDSAMPSITLPTKSGFKFQGYYDSNGVQYYNANGGSVRNYDKTDYTTLYARWADTQAPTISRITWQQNGSTGYYAYAYVTDNVGVNRVQFPTWTDLNGQDDIQTNWQTSSAASGTNGSWTVGGQTYNYRYTVNVSAHNNEYGSYNTHVYAYDAAGNSSASSMGSIVFKFTVTLNTNKGSGSTTPSGGSSSVTATYGSAMPSATMPTRAGYLFQGYYDTSATTGGTQYYTNTGASARAWNKTANTTLYARWKAKVHSVYFSGSTGSGASSGTSATFDQPMQTITPPYKDGYNFLGYFSTSATTGGTQYYNPDGTSAHNWDRDENDGSTLSIYARWQEKTWTDGYYASSYGGGNGTQSNPYQIKTAEQLAYLAYQTNNGTDQSGIYFIQTADIDLNAHLWQPIGQTSTNTSVGLAEDKPFNGNYDGNLYNIKNIRIDGSLFCVGLFGFVSSFKNGYENPGVLKGIHIIGGEILTTDRYAGGIVGRNETSIIENCIVEGVVITATSTTASKTFVGRAGGIAGLAGNIIKNCISKNNIITANSNRSGGLVAITYDSILDCCVINNEINYTLGDGQEFQGGVFGYYNPWGLGTGALNDATYICYGQGTVNGTSTKVMYGDSSAWTNWSLVPNVNGGLPVQKGLYHIGGFTDSQEVYNYLTDQGYTVIS